MRSFSCKHDPYSCGSEKEVAATESDNSERMDVHGDVIGALCGLFYLFALYQ